MNGLPVAVVENGAVTYIRTDHIGRPRVCDGRDGREGLGGQLSAVWRARTSTGTTPYFTVITLRDKTA